MKKQRTFLEEPTRGLRGGKAGGSVAQPLPFDLPQCNIDVEVEVEVEATVGEEVHTVDNLGANQ
jgi:hypothetical protein